MYIYFFYFLDWSYSGMIFDKFDFLFYNMFCILLCYEMVLCSFIFDGIYLFFNENLKNNNYEIVCCWILLLYDRRGRM